MANLKASIKSARQDKKRRARNASAKSSVKTYFLKAVNAIQVKGKESAELVKNAISAIDKAVERGIIHKNVSARKKSRLMKKYNVAFKG